MITFKVSYDAYGKIEELWSTDFDSLVTFKVSYDAYDKIEELWSTDKFELKFS